MPHGRNHICLLSGEPNLSWVTAAGCALCSHAQSSSWEASWQGCVVFVFNRSVHPEGEMSAGCAQSGQPYGLQETGHCSVVIWRAGGSSWYLEGSSAAFSGEEWSTEEQNCGITWSLTSDSSVENHWVRAARVTRKLAKNWCLRLKFWNRLSNVGDSKSNPKNWTAPGGMLDSDGSVHFFITCIANRRVRPGQLNGKYSYKVTYIVGGSELHQG